MLFSQFGKACRCDDQGNCLDTSLPQGVNLTLCVFTQGSFELIGIERFSLMQGETILELLPGSAPNETVRASCTADLCVVQADVGDSFYGSTVNETEASLTAFGVAMLKPALRRQLALSAEMDFAAQITLAAKTDQVVVDDNGDNNNSSRGEELDGPGNGDLGARGGGSNKVVSWLFPLMLLLVVAVACVFIVFRQRAGGSFSSY
jgi:hypothetical protein